MPTQDSSAASTLIGWLLKLHDDHDKAHDTLARGKLANLRYGLRDRLHADYPVGRVFPALTEGALTESDERNEWHTLVAALFGYAHDDVDNAEGISLGAASRTLYDRRENESLERRFMGMLNSDAEYLPGYLRQTVSLLKAEKIGLDWKMLLADVCRWNALGQPVQKKWTRDYYRRRGDGEQQTDDADSK
jgi:CRISPR type I-E-associated protein CasB/Cse2